VGNPANYSLELPERCLKLLDSLWPHAQEIRPAKRPDLGPLTSTFLISMSMPIINLPIERIERRDGGEHLHYADDRKINAAAAAAITKTLQKRRLRDAPFFVGGEWRFARCDREPFPNIAHGVPECIAAQLDRDTAAETAANMPALQWCSILRNALAHGGIAFLNAEGRSAYGEAVKMYAFVSGTYDRKIDKRPMPLSAVNFLRISEDDYFDFLRRWVDWLQDSGIARASEAA
jgi:hypothetical protein